jgi:hypothetical protein
MQVHDAARGRRFAASCTEARKSYEEGVDGNSILGEHHVLLTVGLALRVAYIKAKGQAPQSLDSKTNTSSSESPEHSFGRMLCTPRRELIAVCLALFLGILLRVYYAPAGGFDREADGFQGAFFGLTSINYERLGIAPTGGYPVVNLDTVVDAPETWYVYGNHSPLFALGEWTALKALGPHGWENAWREGRSPSGVGTDHSFEFALRLPMFAASIFSMLVLWWALRIEGGKRAAWIGMLLYALCPLAILDAGLVNYEPASILCVLFAFGFFAKLRRRDAICEESCIFRKELLFVCLFLALGTAQTFAPLFFAIPLCFAALGSRLRAIGIKGALLSASAIGFAALLPVLVHGIYVRSALEGIQPASRLSERIGILFEPLTSGSVPLWRWLGLQHTHLVTFASEVFVEIAIVGLVFAILIQADRLLSKGPEVRASKKNPALLPLLLAAGGFTVMFGYYKHTADDTPAQSSFILNLIPAIAALGGLAFVIFGDAVGRTFARKGRVHGGLILTAVLLGLALNNGFATTNHLWGIWRSPRPQSTVPELVGATLGKLLPPESVALYPAQLGFTPAVYFYAWRTMLPVTADIPSFQMVEQRLSDGGLLDRPRYLILPDAPSAGTKPAVDALRELFATMTPELASLPPIQVDGWSAWRLDTPPPPTAND